MDTQEATQGPDPHGPKAKGKKRGPKAKRPSGPRGPRQIADSKIEDELESFFESVDQGWDPFGSDDAFSDDAFSDELSEGEPERKKSKQGGLPGTKGASFASIIH